AGELLPSDPTIAPLLVVTGAAHVVDAGTLTIDDPTRGRCTVTFDAGASPGIAFPPQLEGAQVVLAAQQNPDARDPAGRPLPYPALRLAIGDATSQRFQLVLVDSPYEDLRRLGEKPRPIGTETVLGDTTFPDFPDFRVFASSARFVPADCGLVYFDVLRVYGEGTATWDLDVGRAVEVPIGTDTPWTVHHVTSWHRTGGCDGSAKTWTQYAARR
ncbi:MAG TPA: hypothetical protein VFP50_12530, partial [Anaeromyxobacteraceae bacterium]|nr:hypothetical protein [Anaeromyxobacteraceae bacterium]